jgi:hypothetical protein
LFYEYQSKISREINGIVYTEEEFLEKQGIRMAPGHPGPAGLPV